MRTTEAALSTGVSRDSLGRRGGFSLGRQAAPSRFSQLTLQILNLLAGSLTAIALGPFDLIGEVSYKWTFKPEHAQEFDSGLAAWPVSRWFTPFVEFRTTTPTVAEDHRTQVTLVPGLNVKPFPRSTLAVGVQLPVTSAREFDYQVRVLFIKEF
jgi:hypothetical protein